MTVQIFETCCSNKWTDQVPEKCADRTKSEAYDTTYKPEHIVDLGSGAAIGEEVWHGKKGDIAGLADRIAAAAEKIDDIHGYDHEASSFRMKKTNTVKNYYKNMGFHTFQYETRICTLIYEGKGRGRRMEKFVPEVRMAVTAEAREGERRRERTMLMVRGAHLERGLVNVLERGGLSLMQLRGRKEISRSSHCGMMELNITVFMGKQFGLGTPRQNAAASETFRAVSTDAAVDCRQAACNGSPCYSALFMAIQRRTQQKASVVFLES